jgi:hypothetical protein
MNDKDIAKSNARWESFNAFLASASKLTGFPALIIACVALIVSTIGLDYIVANYNLQKESIRPALVALSAFINSAGPNNSEVVFQWNNVGRGTLRQGTVDLFAASNDEAWQKLGRTTLDRVATNIPGGMGAGSTMARREISS